MHHNNQKYGEIVVDFKVTCYIPKPFCSMKEDLGWLILGLLFIISEYGP